MNEELITLLLTRLKEKNMKIRFYRNRIDLILSSNNRISIFYSELKKIKNIDYSIYNILLEIINKYNGIPDYIAGIINLYGEL